MQDSMSFGKMAQLKTKLSPLHVIRAYESVKQKRSKWSAVLKGGFSKWRTFPMDFS